ncbi:MAG: thermonuclease family protein [Fuerstiella sp.]|nr:thermonuclease family protein [Fuerstiella sp.]
MTVEVDLGFDVSTTQKLRLYGINAWEVRGDERPQGLIARDWFREQVPIGSTIYLKTQKDKRGKYGRYLATVYDDLDSQALNHRLVELGHAKYQKY